MQLLLFQELPQKWSFNAGGFSLDRWRVFLCETATMGLLFPCFQKKDKDWPSSVIHSGVNTFAPEAAKVSIVSRGGV
jgi:hypothetical protein